MHKSTISRELKRNSKKRSYNANYASTLSKERKRESYKRAFFDQNKKQYIDKKLTQNQWSPEQIKGRCDLDGIPMLGTE
ncbi:MAG: IS30 family transposase [Glaciecola sp.]